MADAEQKIRHGEAHQEESFLRKYVFSTDHKVIGIQFLATSFVMALIGAGMSLLIRVQLGWPATDWIDANAYYGFVTLHGTIMIFFVLTTGLTGGFGNFLIPLQVGAKDMAFPWLNMVSYWLFPTAVVVLLASLFTPGGPASAGWTAYPPLSVLVEANPGSGLGQTLWLISIGLLMASSLLGGINYLTTIFNMRTRGLSLTRLPLTIWGLLITVLIALFAFPVLISAMGMLLLDRSLSTSFFLPAGLLVGGQTLEHAGGDPLLYQHLFWFFGHPEVYILILPAMGMISDIISTNARKPIFGYHFMIASMVAIGFLSFLVWGHHMFTAGGNPYLGLGYMLTTLVIALPSAIKTFNWLATLWRGKIRYTTALLFAIGFVSLFVAGGLSGILVGAPALDSYFQDTYFVISHFHLVMGAASLFGIFAGIYHWFPKMFGRLLDERLGRLHFWVTFIGIYAIFFPMYFLGFAGMLRRYYDPNAFAFLQDLGPLNVLISVAAFVVFAVQVPFVYNIAVSLVRGRRAGRNPWEATTLEWDTPSPPPHLNWGGDPPTVYRWAYAYSVPGAEIDFIPQSTPPRGQEPEPGRGPRSEGEVKDGQADERASENR